MDNFTGDKVHFEPMSEPSEEPYKRNGWYLIKPNGTTIDLGWYGQDSESVEREIREAYAQGRQSMQAEVDELKAKYQKEFEALGDYVGKVHFLEERWKKIKLFEDFLTNWHGQGDLSSSQAQTLEEVIKSLRAVLETL